jgi:hypothetical protein|tara:strand:+ start:401 stop:685 length:285 start_codon:yes stop_codon:yes gene_type:complete
MPYEEKMNANDLELISALHAKHSGIGPQGIHAFDPNKGVIIKLSQRNSEAYQQKGILKNQTDSPTWDDITPEVQEAYLKGLEVVNLELHYEENP